MNSEFAVSNSYAISKDFEWLSFVLECRLKIYRNETVEYDDILLIPLPVINKEESKYESVMDYYNLSFSERVILLLALIPRIKPELLAPLLFEKGADGGLPVEFGGFKNAVSNMFIPTVQTVIFILAGNSLDYRLQLFNIFDKEHFFHKYSILKAKFNSTDEGLLNATIELSDQYFELLVNGQNYVPPLSEKFPAKLLTTTLAWEDLVLSDTTMEKVEQIRTWIKYGNILMEDWDLRKIIKPGYRSLFYGPPGTGKTLTAALLGKVTGLDVYRVDLSMTVSKWIGETEKNLSNLFDQAENQNWILFFDEADALFSQRTKVQSSNDRSSNQQVAYLLQRMEDFPGIIIMASNLKQNIDEAFTRRIQNIIHFPSPSQEERLLLWENVFLNKYFLIESDIDFKKLSEKHVLTGGNIINILRYVCIQAIALNSKIITKKALEEALTDELQKEGKFAN